MTLNCNLTYLFKAPYLDDGYIDGDTFKLARTDFEHVLKKIKI